MNWRRLLSYLWPLKTKIPSRHSGTLELTWINGRKVVDSAHANYSFGSLQKILEIGLQQVYQPKIQSVLVLGLGAGSVVQSLREKFKYQGFIQAVEWEAVLIELACKEYGICANTHLQIACADAEEYLASDPNTYDLLIVDLFIDNQVPEQFLSAEWAAQLEAHLNQAGSIVLNLGMKPDVLVQAQTFSSNFHQLEGKLLQKVAGTNLLYCGKRH